MARAGSRPAKMAGYVARALRFPLILLTDLLRLPGTWRDVVPDRRGHQSRYDHHEPALGCGAILDVADARATHHQGQDALLLPRLLSRVQGGHQGHTPARRRRYPGGA